MREYIFEYMEITAEMKVGDDGEFDMERARKTSPSKRERKQENHDAGEGGASGDGGGSAREKAMAAVAKLAGGADMVRVPFATFKAFHGADLGYVFGQLTMFGATPDDTDKAFAHTIADTWVRFAKTGNPNGGPINDWQPFTSGNESYFVLGAELRSESELRLPQMDLIEDAWQKRREAK